MASLYADENYHFGVVAELRKLGHDILTAYEAGQANQGILDSAVLAYGTSLGRAVLTHNRKHYIKLHKKTAIHNGIIACTADQDVKALAQRVHQALLAEATLDNKLLRVNKQAKP